MKFFDSVNNDRTSPDYWPRRYFDAARAFIYDGYLRDEHNNPIKITEEYYKQHFLREKDPYVGNPLLRQSPKEFEKFIAKLSVENRRLFFFLSTGKTYDELSAILGYSSTTRLQKFIDANEKKALNSEFLARISVYFRAIPVALEHKIYKNEWVTQHFHKLNVEQGPLEINELLHLIHKTNENESWAYGRMIFGLDGKIINLRIESQNGNILIEFFDNEVDPLDMLFIVNSLKEHKYKLFYTAIYTMVASKRIAAILCIKYNEIPYKFSSEFVMLG